MDFTAQLRVLKAAEGNPAQLALATIELTYPRLSKPERNALQEALLAAAIPHWCDETVLSALLGISHVDSAIRLAQLRGLPVVEPFPARGQNAVNVHEASRLALRNLLIAQQPDRFHLLTERAYVHFSACDGPHSRIEAVIHRALCQPAEGSAEIKQLLHDWASSDRVPESSALRIVLDELLACPASTEHVRATAAEHVRQSFAMAVGAVSWSGVEVSPGPEAARESGDRLNEQQPNLNGNEGIPPLSGSGFGTCEASSYSRGSSSDSSACRKYQPPCMAYDPGWYVDRRPQQEEALRCIRWPGKPIVFRGPKFSGKTWLMKHVLGLKRKEVRSLREVNIDFSQSPGSTISVDSLLRHIVEQIGQRLGATEDDLVQLWNSHHDSRIKATNAMAKFLPNARSLVVMAIEGFDQLIDDEVRQAFFGMLRSWLDCKTDPGWQKLRVLMSTSSTRLDKDINRSPLGGILELMEVDEIAPEQVRLFATLYALNWGDTELKTLNDFVGSKPHLLRRVMYLAAVHHRELEALLAPNASTFEAHLNWIRGEIKSHNLATAFAMLKRDRPVSLCADTADHLYRLGVIRQADGACRSAGAYQLSCPVYKRLRL